MLMAELRQSGILLALPTFAPSGLFLLSGKNKGGFPRLCIPPFVLRAGGGAYDLLSIGQRVCRPLSLAVGTHSAQVSHFADKV